MKIDLTEVQTKVRAVLKSIGAIKPGAQAPEPPADPDALDQRLEGAAPTQEGMADAGAEAAAGQAADVAAGGGEGDPGADPGGAAPAGEGGEPDASESGNGGSSEGGGDEGGDGRPVTKALGEGEGDGTDTFGNHDLSGEEIRTLEKSFGNGTGTADPDELLSGGPDLGSVLTSILQGLEDVNIVMQSLHDEIATLKAGQTATNRKLSKALTDLQPEAHLEEPPAPIAAPKAITRVVAKALPGGPDAPPAPLSPDQIFAGLKTGALSMDSAMASVRQSRTPAQ